MYFHVYVLGFCPYTGKFGLEKTFIFACLIQCATGSIGITFSSVVNAKFCVWSVKLAALFRTDIFKNFLPYTINEWNKLDPEIRRVDSYVGFWNKLLTFIKPNEIKTLSIYDPLGIKFLNRLRT